LTFAPWVVQLFYSSEFAQAANLLPWLVLGVFGRVISWPLGFVMIALGRAGVYAATEALFNGLHIGLVLGLVRYSGKLEGVAIALPLMYFLYTILVVKVAGALIGFYWTAIVRRLLISSVFPVLAAFLAVWLLPQPYATALAASLTIVCTIFCVRGLTRRLGPQHQLTRLATRIPWLVQESSRVV
jgi:antigen flippase